MDPATAGNTRGVCAALLGILSNAWRRGGHVMRSVGIWPEAYRFFVARALRRNWSTNASTDSVRT
jgi:hypothetical protein